MYLSIQRFAEENNLIDNYEYVDITDEILKNSTPNYSKIKKIFEYKEYNLSNTKFDTKDITDLELDVARRIQDKIGGVFELIHRVQIDRVTTPDAKYSNKKLFDMAKYFDIKSPKRSENLNSKNKKISRQFDEAKKQANNIIISLLRDNCDLTNNDAIIQIEKCLKNDRYNWIESVILIGKNDYIKIYKKKKKP